MLIAKSDGSGRDTMKEEEYLTSATDTLLDMTVNIYPNPTNDRVFVSTVAGEACGSLKARLMTTTGVLLEERLIENTAESFDMAGRASGIYLLEISGNGEQHLWKILKR
ncbi:MAG: T9SS type A sorting domain-containing protein [Bacteroidales bacterium]|nr:T9SS type A sorting domain-containing protein [Bacteroidales bacterium]